MIYIFLKVTHYSYLTKEGLSLSVKVHYHQQVMCLGNLEYVASSQLSVNCAELISTQILKFYCLLPLCRFHLASLLLRRITSLLSTLIPRDQEESEEKPKAKNRHGANQEEKKEGEEEEPPVQEGVKQNST